MTLRQWIYRNLYLRSSYWRWLRRRISERAKWTCQVRGCKQAGRNLDCHHKTYRILGISILFFEWLFPWVMVYLCRDHHNRTHDGEVLYLKGGGTLRPFGR